ncbi:MAG: hypothetical protein K9J30_04195 [Bacteroidales bacterium]|nr:hypothetical protein [Bacteroidales bacterium]
MMKRNFILLAIIFGLSASTAFSMNSDPKLASDNPAIPAKTENKLSEEEVIRLTKRVEEIRDMDKSNLTSEEKVELRKELKEYKKALRNNKPFIYIGGAGLLLIIILVILLV